MNKNRALILMTVVTASWGASYMWMKVALTGTNPLTLVGLRFCIAFIATLIVFPHALQHITRAHLLASLILGTLLFSLFASVMFGLIYTDATTAGFLVSTTAMFVMLFSALIHRKLPQPVAWLTTTTVMIGLYLLVAKGHVHLSIGAPLCLLTAAIYALHILYANRVTRRLKNTFNVSVLQLGVAGAEGMLCAFFFGGINLPAGATQWGAILALGLICSAFGFVAQTRCQRFLNPATVSMIFSLEPLFSAFFGIWLLGEQLSGLQWLGAGILFCGVFVNEVVTARSH